LGFLFAGAAVLTDQAWPSNGQKRKTQPPEAAMNYGVIATRWAAPQELPQPRGPDRSTFKIAAGRHHCEGLVSTPPKTKKPHRTSP